MSLSAIKNFFRDSAQNLSNQTSLRASFTDKFPKVISAIGIFLSSHKKQALGVVVVSAALYGRSRLLNSDLARRLQTTIQRMLGNPQVAGTATPPQAPSESQTDEDFQQNKLLNHDSLEDFFISDLCQVSISQGGDSSRSYGLTQGAFANDLFELLTLAINASEAAFNSKKSELTTVLTCTQSFISEFYQKLAAVNRVSHIREVFHAVIYKYNASFESTLAAVQQRLGETIIQDQ